MDWLLTQLETIPHIKRLRIHSRLPIVIPARITDAPANAPRSSPVCRCCW